MPPAKTLRQHVVDGSFRSRRHHTLLSGAVLPWPELAEIQARYVAASSAPEKRALGVAFERAVRKRLQAQDPDDEPNGTTWEELQEILNAPPRTVVIRSDEYN